MHKTKTRNSTFTASLLQTTTKPKQEPLWKPTADGFPYFRTLHTLNTRIPCCYKTMHKLTASALLFFVVVVRSAQKGKQALTIWHLHRCLSLQMKVGILAGKKKLAQPLMRHSHTLTAGGVRPYSTTSDAVSKQITMRMKIWSRIRHAISQWHLCISVSVNSTQSEHVLKACRVASIQEADVSTVTELNRFY